MIFHCPAPIYHRFTISNFKCLFMRVIYLDKLVATNKVLRQWRSQNPRWLPIMAANCSQKIAPVTSIILKEIVRP